VTIGAFPFTSLFLASQGASQAAPRAVPSNPVTRAARVLFNDETIRAFYLVIDARGRAEQEEDLASGSLKGPVALFFQGHAQRPADAYAFTSLVAGHCRSGVAVVPVCDTPFGRDENRRGDDGKMPVLREVARFALAPLGIRVKGEGTTSDWPALVDGLPVDDRACPVSAGLMAVGWSHGGILARRFAHAYPESVSALGQVCPAGYECLTPVLLAGRFAREALRISRITAGTHTLDALRSALGFARGFTGDIVRSLVSAALTLDPAKALRAARDIQDCSMYCDSSLFGLRGLARIAVIFGKNDTCMSPLRVLGAKDGSGLAPDVVSGFWQRYYADVSPEASSLHLDILPGTHLGPVTHSDLYAKTLLRNLNELSPGD
jgi:pimeloyl-ACP methyl ester carboxylesterase